MKLAKLQKLITPLPWTMDKYGHVKDACGNTVPLTGFALSMNSDANPPAQNNLYVFHCANVLPELVNIATEMLRELNSTRSVEDEKFNAKYRKWNDAIARAEEEIL